MSERSGIYSLMPQQATAVPINLMWAEQERCTRIGNYSGRIAATLAMSSGECMHADRLNPPARRPTVSGRAPSPRRVTAEIARLHVVAIAVEAQLEDPARAAARPLPTVEIALGDGAVGLDAASVRRAQDVPAFAHIALREFAENGAAGHRHRGIGEAVDMAQIDWSALALRRIRQPERARDRQERRESLRRVAGDPTIEPPIENPAA